MVTEQILLDTVFQLKVLEAVCVFYFYVGSVSHLSQGTEAGPLSLSGQVQEKEDGNSKQGAICD